jgi:CobQ-like glutamine amidotransferase family enzyme
MRLSGFEQHWGRNTRNFKEKGEGQQSSGLGRNLALGAPGKHEKTVASLSPEKG